MFSKCRYITSDGLHSDWPKTVMWEVQFHACVPHISEMSILCSCSLKHPTLKGLIDILHTASITRIIHATLAVIVHRLHASCLHPPTHWTIVRHMKAHTHTHIRAHTLIIMVGFVKQSAILQPFFPLMLFPFFNLKDHGVHLLFAISVRLHPWQQK